jgi:hypothetical protein
MPVSAPGAQRRGNLALLGGVFYAAHRLHQPWRKMTQIDPLYTSPTLPVYGHAGIHEALPAALPVALAAAIAFFAIATAVIARGCGSDPDQHNTLKVVPHLRSVRKAASRKPPTKQVTARSEQRPAGTR